MRTVLVSALILGSSILAGCTNGSTTTVPGDDELAGEANDGEAPKADGTDTFGILTAQKIGAFECNGAGSCTHVALARAGRSTTTCADGKTTASCDVRTLDFGKLGLSATKLGAVADALQASAATPEIGPQLLVRGVYKHGTNPLAPGVDWVTFVVSEVWLAQVDGGTVDGTFVMVHDNNIRCITAPCPSLAETRLNSTRVANIDALDWSDSEQSGALETKVANAYGDADGVIVNGFRTHAASGPKATFRSVEQVFLRIK